MEKGLLKTDANEEMSVRENKQLSRLRFFCWKRWSQESWCDTGIGITKGFKLKYLHQTSESYMM